MIRSCGPRARRGARLLGVAGLVAGCGTGTPSPEEARLVGLVDELVMLDQEDLDALGGSWWRYDSEWLLGGNSGGSRLPRGAAALNELVASGPDAIRTLLSHLGDDRPTTYVIELSDGVDWLASARRYCFMDRNRWVDPGTNRGGGELSDEPYGTRVGDWCFTALGRITNRRYGVFSGYKFGVDIAPLHSCVSFHEELRARWFESPDRVLLDQLQADIRLPDSSERRLGAVLRLMTRRRALSEHAARPAARRRRPGDGGHLAGGAAGARGQ